MSAPRRTYGAARRRSARRLNRHLAALLLVAAIIILLWGWHMLAADKKNRPGAYAAGLACDHDALLEVIAPDDLEQDMLQYTGFAVSFNPSRHIPNYSAWILDTDRVKGELPRGKFHNDPYVIGSADPGDYVNSGYDRGHMAPAADMKWHAEAMNDCFSMTNIVPQSPKLNQRAWKNVEDKCRARIPLDSTLVIICGPIPNANDKQVIGANRVAVPSQFFKVILAPRADPPYSIAFIMNNGPVEGGMQRAATTVNHVEEITGYDFFSALPDSIEEQIESQCNFAKWSRLK